MRIERNMGKKGGERNSGGDEFEDEEQEKRALESPKRNGEFSEEENVDDKLHSN